MQRNGKNTRVYILAGILMVWGAAISARLVYLQVFCYGEGTLSGHSASSSAPLR